MTLIRPQFHLGIDISENKLRLVVLKKSYRRLELQAFCDSDVPLGTLSNGTIMQPAVLVKLLHDLPKHCTGGHISSRSVHVGLPEQQSFITTVPLAAVIKDEIAKATKRALPLHENEVYYDMHVLKSLKTVMVAAGRKSIVDHYVSIIEQANYHLIGLHTEAEAVAQALLPLANATTHGTIIIDIGSARTTFIFFLHGSVWFTTSYPTVITGLTLNQQHLTAAIQQIILYYREHYGPQAALEQIILCGSGAYIPNIAAFVQQCSQIPTRLGDPLQNLKPNHITKKMNQPLLFTTAIGLALA